MPPPSKGGKYSIVEDAALVTDGPLIHWIGPRAELPPTTTPNASTSMAPG